MSVESYTDGVSIGPYQEWKDNIIAYAIVIGIYLFFIVAMILFLRWDRRKSIERFVQLADELRKKGKLKSADEQVIDDARTIYASFIRPKGRFWSRIFGEQRFD
jgi:hypothetical protein